MKLNNRNIGKLRVLIGLVLFCISSAIHAQSQKFEFRSHIGVVYYQGDLSPLPIDLSFSKGHLAVGVSGGYNFNKFLSIHARMLKGTLSGSDEDASNTSRRRRNLSFTSPLEEYGLSAEFNFNALFKNLDRYGLKFYYTTGINMYKFNPRTYYNGQWIDLKPLGTEGQGIAGVGEGSDYNLTQYNVPFGIGVKFKIKNRYSFGLELSSRWTFTDYIDDVSTSFVSYQDLLENNGVLSATLANRTGEYLNTPPISPEPGSIRGDRNDNDWYMYTGMYFSYSLGQFIKAKIINGQPVKIIKPGI